MANWSREGATSQRGSARSETTDVEVTVREATDGEATNVDATDREPQMGEP